MRKLRWKQWETLLIEWIRKMEEYIEINDKVYYENQIFIAVK